MTLYEQLLHHAVELVASESGNPEAQEVRNRRVISAAYYALFHRLTHDASELLGPHMSGNLRARVARWLDHAEMKRVCSHFTKARLERPLRDLLGETAPPPLQFVATSFIELQEARHRADYDLTSQFTHQQALKYLETAVRANGAWRSIVQTSEANVFMLSLFLWKTGNATVSSLPSP